MRAYHKRASVSTYHLVMDGAQVNRTLYGRHSEFDDSVLDIRTAMPHTVFIEADVIGTDVLNRQTK